MLVMGSAKALQNRVREFRTRLGLRQVDLACEVGVTRQTIIAIEKGKLNPSVVLSLKLARALGEPVENLFSLPQTLVKRLKKPHTVKHPRRSVPGQVMREEAPPAVAAFAAPAASMSSAEDAEPAVEAPKEPFTQAEEQVPSKEAAPNNGEDGQGGQGEMGSSAASRKPGHPVQEVWDFT